MKSLLLAVLLLPILVTKGVGQWSHGDDSIFQVRTRSAIDLRIDTIPLSNGPMVSGRPMLYAGPRIAAAGELFLGTPYVAGTLDVDTQENLVIDLHGFDCVTFYENAIALASTIYTAVSNSFNGSHFTTPLPDEHTYEAALTNLRYRGGVRDGFHSRLNYTIDYFYDNNKRGNLLNVTSKVGGTYVKHDDRTIDFMTHHRTAYKQLAHNDAEFAAMQKVERDIHARGPFSYIPKEDISKIEQNIHTGDVLGITTNIEGLDCSHTGIAIKMDDGRIHFMNASSLMGKVIISEESLVDYLTHSSHQTGIIVMRPVWPVQKER
ncbi:MAG TPA: N-acetylmuramoyl-L-alanine amidase-like domain-containing protein [Candidatus Kapabacteria bacterium]|jgi:hypothetical protein